MNSYVTLKLIIKINPIFKIMDKYRAFYKKGLDRRQQKEYVQSILDEYKGKPINDETFQELYDRLSWEKHLGNIDSPFKLHKKADQFGHDYLEVLLETKI